ncbi:type II toxin-antitoxin system PemK/MazF family toxin [Xenorhabdus bovienii]|uniref:MazF-like protein n=1 Tax=Xenorhabdus bovienii TaxID=40576 RepID=A0A0B6X7C9_XENBV
MAKKSPLKVKFGIQTANTTSGREFKGSHYYLVISDEQLNKPLGTAICIPITSA